MIKTDKNFHYSFSRKLQFPNFIIDFLHLQKS